MAAILTAEDVVWRKTAPTAETDTTAP